MDFVLVPGFWLGGWAWDEVAQSLRDAGHRVWQVTLPGLARPEDERAGISLDDHIELPLPSWEELEAQGNSVEGLSDAAKALFRRRAVPQPAGPARDPLKLSDPGRLNVPTVLVNCSMPTAKVLELIAAGHPWFAELANLSARHTELPTGHWPMFSRPKDLAELLLEVAAA